MSQDVRRLRVNPVACTGHGVCAELLPELVTLDEWGYPVIAENGVVPARLARRPAGRSPTARRWPWRWSAARSRADDIQKILRSPPERARAS